MLATTSFLELHGLAAAESEQLPGEAGGPLSGVDRLGNGLLIFSRGHVSQLQKGQVSQDRRQNIVEVVSDTRGQLAERLHFLCLA